MAAKGRARIEREIRSARAMGKFAVDHAPRFLAARAGSPSGGRPPERPATPRSPAAPRGVSVSGRRAEPVTAPREATPGAARRPPVGPRPETRTTVDHAIPGYDSLSASQVVRRLDSLTPAELEAVVRHESATRGRRTILHRAEQLLGQGQSPPSAGGVDPAHA